MAIPWRVMALLQPVFAASKSVFSLGYPDLLLSKEAAKKIFGVDLKKTHPANETARKQHAMPFDLIDTEEFFDAMHISFSCCDIAQLRGCEIIADLNYPQEFPQADFVIDAGTIEHCFNISQAALNAANTVAPGGVIFHGNPLSMVNHGFYCLSPTWYTDFYKDNGWDIVLQATMGVNDEIHELEFPLKRAKFASELSNIFMAIKPKNVREMRFPTQTKYKRMLS